MRRFTDTEKWSDPWFRSLRAVHKLIFLFIVDRCNNAGFYELDIDYMVFHTGLERKHIEAAWQPLERGIKMADGWVWVRQFLKHQKNADLNPVNPAHKQIIFLHLEQHQRFISVPEYKSFIGAYKGLLSPSSTGKGKGKKEESAERKQQAAEIYAAYPYRVGKPFAVRAIIKALDKGMSPEILLAKTKSYAEARKDKIDFTPNPSTWYNQERYNDDPATWGRSDPKPAEKAKITMKDVT